MATVRLQPTPLPLIRESRLEEGHFNARRMAWLTGGSMVASDVLALCASAATSVLAWFLIEAKLEPSFYVSLWPLLAVFAVAYLAAGLYPGIVLNPVEEFRRTTVSTSLVYATLGAATFLTREFEPYSRAVFILSWAQALFLVPWLRRRTKSLCAGRPWWGQPAVILGCGPAAESLLAALRAQPELGLKPTGVFRIGDAARSGPEGSALTGELEEALVWARERRIRWAILAAPEISRAAKAAVFDRSAEAFERLIVIPELTGLRSLWVETTDIGGTLGLEIRQRLLLPSARFLKRLIDLLLVISGGLVLLPLMLLVAASIKLTSPGPVFYGHLRYGLGGRPFRAWKFRSMAVNGDEILRTHLSRNPAMRLEWKEHRKLARDPRITPLGALLRRSSLDELPQLWNVIRGEMSLVGPRPIVAEEIPRYAENFAFYKKVTPGITGLWQVSGRSQTSYAERIRFDLYYVSNWSVWLDVHILARTVTVVLRGRGAC